MKRKGCQCRYLGRVVCYAECDTCKRARLEKGLAYWSARSGEKAKRNVEEFLKALADLGQTRLIGGAA